MLLTLDPDLQCVIAQALSPADVIALRRTCRRLRAFVAAHSKCLPLYSLVHALEGPHVVHAGTLDAPLAFGRDGAQLHFWGPYGLLLDRGMGYALGEGFALFRYGQPHPEPLPCAVGAIIPVATATEGGPGDISGQFVGASSLFACVCHSTVPYC